MRKILLSTPTSATGSLWRILHKIDNLASGVSVVDEFLKSGDKPSNLRSHIFDKADGLYLFNQPRFFNYDFYSPSSERKIVVNFRDPRDLLCNMYYWQFIHPSKRSPEENERYKSVLLERGIDWFCESQDFSENFHDLLNFIHTHRLNENLLICSYAQMCFSVEEVVLKLIKFFHIDTVDSVKLSKICDEEHPSFLLKFKPGISHSWAGSDFVPGRARVELKPATFKKLSSKYEKYLTIMKELDNSKFAFFYDC